MSQAHPFEATYDFTQADRVICIGDLEGQYPFFETTDKERTETLPKNWRGKMMFSIDKPEKPIVINADSRTALVTCGDLIDHGKYDIRLLQACTNENPNTIWTIGNRDINKIRLIDEFFICKKGYAITLPWKDGNFESLEKVIQHVYHNIENYKFMFEYDAIKRRFQNWKAPPPDVFKDIYTLKNTSMAEYVKKRVHDIYSKTLGVTEMTAGVYHHYDELVEIGLLLPQQNIAGEELQLFKCICICVTNMIMCIEWNEENGINAQWFQALNGLHTKYIRKAHIMSTFKFNNETAVVSHSGLPEIVSDSLGYGDCDGCSSSEIALIVNNIDVEKEKFIRDFNQYWNNKINKIIKNSPNYRLVPAVYHIFNKYIELSNYNGVTLNNKEFSPITNAVSFRGGDEWYDQNYYRKAENKSGLKYNIFGHQPQGVMPNIKQQANGIYDIGLDNSVVGKFTMKGHEVAYNASGAFSYLEFNKNKDPHFKGCVMHTSSFDLVKNGEEQPKVDKPTLILTYDKILGEFKAFRDQYQFDSGPTHAHLTLPQQYGGKRKTVRKKKAK